MPVVSIRDILPALRLEADPPLLGWVFSDEWAAKNPAPPRDLIDARTRLKALLKTDDAVWDKLAPDIMDAEDDARSSEALKEGLSRRHPRTATGTRTCWRRKVRLEVMRAADPASVANLERSAGRDLLVRLPEMNPRRRRASRSDVMPRLEPAAVGGRTAGAAAAGAAMAVADARRPRALATFQAGYAELMRGSLLFHVAITLARVAVAFTLSPC